MALKYKVGQKVRQVVKPIEGVILGQRIVDDGITYIVGFVNSEGHEATAALREEDLEGVVEEVVPPQEV